DRAVGLLVLMALGGLMVAIRYPLFLQQPTTLWPALLLLFLLAGFSSVLFALFHHNRFEHWALFQRMEKNTRLGPWIRRAYDSIYFFRSHPRAVGWAVVLSLVNTFLLTLSCAAFGQALYLPVTHLDYLTLFPLITVLAAIPLTPGSLGVREGLFVTLFGALGIDRPSAFLLSLLVYAAGTVWSVFGGLLFLAGPEKKKRKKGACVYPNE
ncbi:MAG: flippase-like domain-containing protein, partial [Synergistales bacterium]|nr:flippase-like domain-containing protein [Synergistales bacterium]